MESTLDNILDEFASKKVDSPEELKAHVFDAINDAERLKNEIELQNIQDFRIKMERALRHRIEEIKRKTEYRDLVLNFNDSFMTIREFEFLNREADKQSMRVWKEDIEVRRCEQKSDNKETPHPPREFEKVPHRED